MLNLSQQYKNDQMFPYLPVALHTILTTSKQGDPGHGH